MKTEGVNVYLTIDREQEGWDGHVGFVPAYLKELGFDTNKTALLCGPPIMIKFCLASLIEMGFSALAIADRVGHESVDITYKYAHLFPSKQQEMAQKLDMERREE